MQPDIVLPKPKKIRIYTAQITQTSTNNPTVTIQQNTLGYDIVWTRDAAGMYTGTLDESILDNQIFTSISGNSWDRNYVLRRTTSSTVQIITGNVVTATLVDGQLNQTPIEIRIYL